MIVVDLYLRLMGDKTIPDSAEPRLESFNPPFVANIDLPHQGVVDSYNTLSMYYWNIIKHTNDAHTHIPMHAGHINDI